MSVVYKAAHLYLDEEVAIKIVSPEFTASAAMTERLKREAQAACALNHENIVKTRAFGIDATGRAFLVMDLVAGESLADRLARQTKLNSLELFKITSDVGRALAHAHSHGVVHRDIKPGNIMLCKQADGSDVCKILDFGIARNLLSTDSGDLTRTGDILGSPLYMSPEQSVGKKVDSRSDIYSLGCVMYESVTGHPLFESESALEIMMKHIEEEPKLELQSSPRLREVILRALQKSPELRYQSVEEMLSDLEQIPLAEFQRIEHESEKNIGLLKSRTKRRRLWLLASVCFVPFAVALAFHYSGVYDKINQAQKMQKLLKSLSTHSTVSKYTLGMQLMRAGKYQEALNDFNQDLEIRLMSLQADPTNLLLTRTVAWEYENRAYTLMKLHRYEEGIKDLDQAIELHPYDQRNFMNRARAYTILGKVDLARKDFERARSMPSDGNALFKIRESKPGVPAVHTLPIVPTRTTGTPAADSGRQDLATPASF
jgi:serine/threonine protein kinase